MVFPCILAAIELNRKNPSRAIEELKHATSYDLGSASAGVTIYYRGVAYLQLRDGGQATAQFQRILNNRGVVTTGIYWPLAHLGLGQARAISGDIAGARAAYEDFFSLWKDADADTPILKRAKTEYAQLLKAK